MSLTRMEPACSRRAALFLDRDGVINVDAHHVHRIEDFVFLPGIFELCMRARTAGLLLFVVTNQAGIGRGYYGEDAFRTLTDWMLQQFRERGVHIERVYHCPFHPTAGIGAYRRESFDRKPNPGMIMKAKDEFGLDLAASALIGDKATDVQAGEAAGVRYNVRLLHEPGAVDAPERLEFASLQAIGDWLGRTFVPPPSG